MSKHKKHYKPKPNFNKPTSTVNQPHKKDSKKTLSFWLVIIFFLICGIGSILGTYSFVENRAKADEVYYNFTGSNVSVPIATDYYNDGTNINYSSASYIASTMFRMSFTSSSTSGSRTVNLLANTKSTVSDALMNNSLYNLFLTLFPPNDNFSGTSSSYYIGCPVLYYYSSATKVYSFNINNLFHIFQGGRLDEESQLFSFSIYLTDVDYSRYWYFFGSLPNGKVFVITMYITCTATFNGQVSHITQGADTLNEYNWNFIKYHSSNGGELAFRFRLHNTAFSAGNNNSSNYLLANRTYIVDFENLDGYNLGYTAGLNANQPNIYQDGYNTGFNAGKNNGYNIGYEDGVNQAGNFNFFSLMSAVIDAPVQAVTGLLDFEIFGFDMSSFFFGFLTISLVVFVLRKVL